MSMDAGQWPGQGEEGAGAASRSADEDPMERVHREFDQRNLRHAVELILASPDAEEIVEELKWRLARRGQASA